MSINKVILVGRAGKDPEVRYIDNNVAVASLTIATTDRAYKTANGTEIPERTEWHNVVLWRGLAEVAEKYVRKGSQIYIEGKLRTRSWVDQTGAKRYTTEIQAETMELLGSRMDTQGNQATAQSGYQSNQTQQPQQMQSPASNYGSPTFSDDAGSADDLPF